MDLIKLFRIPDYINTSDVSDVNAWRATRTCLDIYYILSESNDIIDDKTIANIGKKFIYMLSEISGNPSGLLLYDLLLKRKEYIVKSLLEREEYMALENIKRLDDEISKY